MEPLHRRPISAGRLTLGRLHSDALRDLAAIRAKLLAARDQEVLLSERAHDLGVFRLIQVGKYVIRLRSESFKSIGESHLVFEFKLDGALYYFASPQMHSRRDLVSVAIPAVLYRAERRDRSRVVDPSKPEVAIRLAEGELHGRILDRSPGGLGVLIETSDDPTLGASVSLRLQNPRIATSLLAEIRNCSVSPEIGWRRLGLSLIPEAGRGPVSHHRVEPEQDRWGVSRLRSATAARGVGSSDARQRDGRIPIVEFENSRGQRISGILDSWGDQRNASCIIVPPAWGRTKETLLSLSATILCTFEQARFPVSVLRFDGTHRRGESYVPPKCRELGLESRNFTFSQAVDDLKSAVRYVQRRFAPRAIVLVTFSAAAIEGRRVVADDNGAAITGWITVVGATDPQALIRGAQRGTDYFAGYEGGLRYGMQEVQGVFLDVDNAVGDAIEHGLAFIDDARRDFAKIRIPVTWIHGRHDGWMDRDRVLDVLSIGSTWQRRLLEVPTGHQLRASREASEVFKVVATEVARMSIGQRIQPTIPEVGWLRRRRQAERARLRRCSGALRGFWRDYLLGRGEGLGMELVAATASYRQLMENQISALSLRDGEHVVDLGSGVGSFLRYLLASDLSLERLSVTEVDYVSDALKHARLRMGARSLERGLRVGWVDANLNLSANGSVPFASSSVDAVLASLLVNYVKSPIRLLREIRRILSDSGRLVLSSLRRDADISTICVDGVAELRTGEGRRSFGHDGEGRLAESLIGFINDAAHLLDFEERGLFSFWERDELVQMICRAGFECVSVESIFGTPPQAFLVVARPV